LPLFLALVALGLAGNFYKASIFLNIDLIFGSVFALLALQFFGLGPGLLAAGAIASVTPLLWNHPYAIPILIAEVAIVGWLTVRRRLVLVLADTLYWLVVGMPLVALFYHGVMGVSLADTWVIMVKQAVNGITNALLARLIFTAVFFRGPSSRLAFHELLYNLLAVFTLCPALFLLTLDARHDFVAIERRLTSGLRQDSLQVSQRLAIWEGNRKTAIVHLAEMASTMSPEAMQPHLEQAAQSDVSFQAIGLINSRGISTAFFPLRDEQGRDNVGRDFADRPYIAPLRRTRQPMFSEVMMSKVGRLAPIVVVLAPVFDGQGEFAGYVAGLLCLDQLEEYLDISALRHESSYTLLDKNAQVIMTNRPGQAVMAPLPRLEGELIRVDAEVSRWWPTAPRQTPAFSRWQHAFYQVETPVGDLAEWKLLLEQPVAPFQREITDHYAKKLSELLLILLGVLALARWLSRRLLSALDTLRGLTRNLSLRLVDESPIDWPDSGFYEQAQLIENFREMAESLAAQFLENRHVREELQRLNLQLGTWVEERTVDLHRAKRLLEKTFASLHEAIFLVDSATCTIFDCNRTCETMFGYRREEMLGAHTSLLHVSEEMSARFAEEMGQPLLEQGVFETTFVLRRKDGSTFDSEHSITPIEDDEGVVVSHVCVVRDISERKRAEEVVSRALGEKTVMLKEIHHRVKNNMQVIHSLLGLQAKAVKDAATRAMFEERRDRVLSMALIHENLYRSDDLSSIDFKKYLQRLVSGISESYQRPDIRLLVVMEELALDITAAIPCGLIVNELVSNSLKHAFPGGRAGQITLGLRPQGEGLLTLVVEDNGIGFPAEIDFRHTASLGLQLVNVLSGQIHGTLDLVREEGTRFCLTFPPTKAVDVG